MRHDSHVLTDISTNRIARNKHSSHAHTETSYTSRPTSVQLRRASSARSEDDRAQPQRTASSINACDRTHTCSLSFTVAFTDRHKLLPGRSRSTMLCSCTRRAEPEKCIHTLVEFTCVRKRSVCSIGQSVVVCCALRA